MKADEEKEFERQRIIRDELRHLRDVGVRIAQLGVTVLASIQTALFFCRKDVFERMLLSGELTPGEGLPLNRYVVGTGFLTLMALIFFGMCMLVSRNYRFYHNMLTPDQKPLVPCPPMTNTGRVLLFLLFFIFPAFDILIKVWIRFEVGLK